MTINTASNVLHRWSWRYGIYWLHPIASHIWQYWDLIMNATRQLQGSNCQNWLLNWMIEIYEGKTLLFRFTLNQISIAKNPNKFVLNFLPPGLPEAWNTKNGQSPTHWALTSLFQRKPLMLLIFQSFCGKFILWKKYRNKKYTSRKSLKKT